jgi:chromosomal replication initiation ATPase DnaA
MEEIISKVSEFTGISVDDIKSRKRTHKYCEARQIFMYLCCKVYRLPQSMIAEYLSDRTKQSISAQLISFDQNLRIYKGLHKNVEKIKSEIINGAT